MVVATDNPRGLKLEIVQMEEIQGVTMATVLIAIGRVRVGGNEMCL